MGDIRVGILGLGRVGMSLALSLARHNRREKAAQRFALQGADERPDFLRFAQKSGVFEKTGRDLRQAARDCDIVALVTPFSELRRALRDLAEALRPGAVLLDFSPLKLPAMRLAAEFPAAEIHLVGVTPVVNPRHLLAGQDAPADAAEDHFENSSMLLMPAPDCAREAVALASDFATLLGAKPHFMDAQEHDSLAAATLALPTLLGASAFHSLSRAPGWDDMQRLTNAPFARLTQPLRDSHPDDLRDLWLEGRADLLRQMDALLHALGQTRAALAADDRAAIEALLEEASAEYEVWLNRRHRNRWEAQDEGPAAPGAGETLMSGLMGDFLGRRLRGNGGRRER